MKKNLLTILCLMVSVCMAKADQVAVIFAGSKFYEGNLTKIEFPEGNRDTDIDGKTFTLNGIGSFVIDRSAGKTLSWIDPAGAKPHLQWAKTSTLTFTLNQGITLTKIEMFCTTKNYTPNGMTCSSGSFAYDDKTYTATWTGAATSILTLDNTPHVKDGKSYDVRIMYMILTYTTGSSGVEDVTTDTNAPVEYYNLQGIRVNHPAQGNLYIRRQGASAQKIFYCE